MQTSKFRKEIIFLNVLLTMAVINFWFIGSNFQEIMRISAFQHSSCTEKIQCENTVLTRFTQQEGMKRRVFGRKIFVLQFAGQVMCLLHIPFVNKHK